uniref:Sema domain-containing protein n=1 Tax=Esox lucius TaxID=8010 RepID=A0AAY5K7D3_ESOLU
MASRFQAAPLLLRLLLLCLPAAGGQQQEEAVLQFLSKTPINNVVQDPSSGRVYLGAVNTIYQLDSELNEQARAETGPKEDARTCTPPVSACQDTKPTPNVNKLLLVHPANGSLIVCGSRYRGICSLVNLTNVEQQLYYSDSKGERTYVASIEDGVAVVGVMSTYVRDGITFDVFLVGKGYGSLDSSKLISTRILQDYRDWVVFESIIEASTVQATPFVPRYMHDFRHAFKEEGFVYFLFSRTMGSTDNKNFNFVSRLCEEDHHYYSYTELQLSCGLGNRYNKVQAAYVASPGKELARVLFMVASPDEDSTDSALCMYPLNAINDKLVEIITACYSDSGKIRDIPAVDIPYSSKTDQFCTSRISVSSSCGADFLPSPLASKPEFALQVEAVFTKNVLLTAVAIAVENDHTIAFLGNSMGEVFKVHLTASPEMYGRWLGDPTRERVNKNLFFSANYSHLYISTEKKVWLVPVQRCHLKRDCQSCMSLRDPYCGWCVLQGRCTRRSDCRRAEEKNGWLWSPNQQCVTIKSFHPPNLSCKKTQQVVHITGIGPWKSSPLIRNNEKLKSVCAFWFTAVSVCIQGAKCPQFENPDPFLIPVGLKTTISFEGINVNVYQVNKPDVLYKNEREQSQCFLRCPCPLSSVTLYNCSVGREDCSLCKNADPKYRCVWCTERKSCVYKTLCTNEQGKEDPQETECPDPQITEITPLYGPLKGGISVTIKGSNLGIRKEDVKAILVVGVPCEHQKDKYAVSTRVVCEIDSLDSQSATRGQVEVELEGGKRGTSLAVFTFRDPEVHSVHPAKGPKAGGTVITISGSHLNTATREDITVTIEGVACNQCQAGLQLSGGRYGGRSVVVTGSGFDLIQNAIMKVNTSTNITSQVWLSSSFSHLHFLFLPAFLFFPEYPRSLFQFRSMLRKSSRDHSYVVLNHGFWYPPLQGRGFSKAMTAKEAQAFVGDVQCIVNTLQDNKLFLDPPSSQPRARSKRHRRRRDTSSNSLDLLIKFGNGEWLVGSVHYESKYEVPFFIIIPAVIVPMLLIILISLYCYRRKSQQAEREYEKVKHQLENLEESVRDRCKKEFTDLMIEMEDHTNDVSEGRIPFLDYKTYTDRVFFLPSKDGANDVMITGKLDIPEARKAIVAQALNQFSNLLNSKTFLINFIRTLEGRPDFTARAKVYFASLLTVALHGKLEYYTDVMRTLLLELMGNYVDSKNPKLMLRRSETVVERMLCNWMSICLYQFLKDSAGEPLYKLFRAIKHQIEKGPVDVRVKKAKYTLNDTGLLGDDVEYCVLVSGVLVHGEGPDVTPVKVLNCDTVSQVKEKIIEAVFRNLPYSLRPTVDSVTLEWRPGSTGQILSDLDLTSQKEGRWRRINTLAHYNVRDNATLVLSRVVHTHHNYNQNQDYQEERNALLEDDKVFHLVRPDELDEMKSKRGSMKDKSMTKAITEIYLTRLLSVKGTLQQFVDDFFRSVLCSGAVVPPAVKYFFDFLDEQALKHDNVDEETIHIWKTNSLPLRFWVNILKNPHFIFDVHVTEVVDASLSVIAQTFMDACTKSEHKLSRDSPSNKLLYAKEISTYKKMVDDYYKGIRQMISVSDQDMNTHLAEVSRTHTDKLNTQVALYQLYQYASKYYDGIIQSLDEDPAAQSKQLTLRLQQIAAALENTVTDL